MSTAAQKADARNYGADILRIVSMFMVVVLHLIGLHGSSVTGAAKTADLAVLSVVYCCVDCYALISGFVGYRKNKYTRNTVSFVTMWCQTVFYGIIIVSAVAVSGLCTVTADSYITALLPLTHSEYWYLTAYFGVFLCAPFINMVIDRIPAASALSVCAGVMIFFSVIPFFTYIYDLQGGYSFVWLILLYIMGAALKKDDLYKRFSNKLLTIMLFVLFAAVNYASAVTKGGSMQNAFQYTDPAVLAEAVMLLLLFANLSPGKAASGIAKFAAPAVFGVFLIHTQPLFFVWVFSKAFAWTAELPSVLPTLACLGCGAGILVVCILIDKLRIKLFEIIHLKKGIEAVYNAVHGLYEKIAG